MLAPHLKNNWHCGGSSRVHKLCPRINRNRRTPVIIAAREGASKLCTNFLGPCWVLINLDFVLFINTHEFHR